jgi:SAM-dependent methyltransferase
MTDGQRIEKAAASYGWQIDHSKHVEFAERSNIEAIASILQSVARPELSYLDLGCGTGTIAEGLYKRGFRWSQYTGIDISSKAIDHFKSRELERTTLVLGDATKVERFPELSFDVILCLFLLQDLSREEGECLLEQLFRLLKPNGWLLLSLTLDPDSSKELGEDYRPQSLEKLGIPGKYTYLWSKPDLQAALVKLGYCCIKSYEEPAKRDLLEMYSLLKRAI